MPHVVRVLLPLPLSEFSYLLPFELEPPEIGVRVAVPWQQGVRLALVVAVEAVSASKAMELRELVSILDEVPFVLPQQIAFLLKLAERICAPPGQLLASLLPVGLTAPFSHEVRAVAGSDVALSSETWSEANQLKARELEVFRRQGLVQERIRLSSPMQTVLRAVRPVDAELSGKARVKQRMALERAWELEECSSAAQLAKDAEVSESVVRALVKKGYLRYEQFPAPPPALPQYDGGSLPSLSDIDESMGAVVGGSRRERLAAVAALLKKDLQKGKSALVLVPEGALLQETARCLASLMPVYALSGELTDRQRERLWSEVQTTPVVLVTTYLGLLAPLKDLARVVVLEEASNSYKLHGGTRLFVPSAASLLAEYCGASLVMTESVLSGEAYQRIPKDKQLWLDYPEMRLHISDLGSAANWPLGSDLIQVLKQVRDRKRQAIILASRRGFSAALGCEDCSWVAQCPNCDLALRYHKDAAALRCHQCGFQQVPPQVCPACESTKLAAMRAAGTQWIAQDIARMVPDLPVYRFDADYRDDLAPLMHFESGVVVATTAVLRHEALPEVSLVAATLVDSLLTASDFRAEEEALRLLLQLAELAPDKRPLMVLQCFQAGHQVLEVLRSLSSAKVQMFLEDILMRRRQYRYPPFAALAKVQVSHQNRHEAEKEVNWLAGALRTHMEAEAEVLGPVLAPVARVRGQHTFQLLVRATDDQNFATLLRPALAYRGSARVRVDIDPRDIGQFIE